MENVKNNVTHMTCNFIPFGICKDLAAMTTVALEDPHCCRVIELEAVLLEECTPAEVWCVAKGRAMPESLRPEVWQACLGVHRKESQLLHFTEIFDLPEQATLRSDCQHAVGEFNAC